VVIRLRLPNGRAYERTGHLNFANNTVTTNTDTITLRGEIENPPTQHIEGSGTPIRELFDGEFVTVLLEGVQPIEVLAVPRSAVLRTSRAATSSWSERIIWRSSAASRSGNRRRRWPA
jgi:membrane fusion protein, multidrug efflux system